MSRSLGGFSKFAIKKSPDVAGSSRGCLRGSLPWYVGSNPTPAICERGRAVDCTGLENQRTRNRSDGSNPSVRVSAVRFCWVVDDWYEW